MAGPSGRPWRRERDCRDSHGSGIASRNRCPGGGRRQAASRWIKHHQIQLLGFNLAIPSGTSHQITRTEVANDSGPLDLLLKWKVLGEIRPKWGLTGEREGTEKVNGCGLQSLWDLAGNTRNMTWLLTVAGMGRLLRMRGSTQRRCWPGNKLQCPLAEGPLWITSGHKGWYMRVLTEISATDKASASYFSKMLPPKHNHKSC